MLLLLYPNSSAIRLTGRAVPLSSAAARSIRCREILRGSSPKSLQCGMKVKDAVLVVQKVLAEESACKEGAQAAE